MPPGYSWAFALALVLFTSPYSESDTAKSTKTQDRISVLYGETSAIFEYKSEMGVSAARSIPEKRHVSAYLIGGVTTRFVHFNKIPGKTLSIVVSPCTSALEVNILFWLPSIQSSTSVDPSSLRLHLKKFRTERIRSFHEYNSREGFYLLEIKALNGDAYVNLYLETGKEAVSVPSTFIDSLSDSPAPASRPKISTRRLRGNRVQVKWESSPVNPHRATYCVVINSHLDYHTLCAAKGVKLGVLPPDLKHVSYYYYPVESPNTRPKLRPKLVIEVPEERRSKGVGFRNATRNRISNPDGLDEKELARDLRMGCVNRKNSYVIDDLEEDKLYYFNVFIKDRLTNLTYPYLKTTIRYRNPKVLLNELRDSKPARVTVHPNQSSILTFKLFKPCSELALYVMSCSGGSGINFEMFLENRPVIEQQPADVLSIFNIAVPLRGMYYLRFTSQGQGNTSASGQVYLSKKGKRFPLPKLPVDTNVYEVRRNRTCDSVLIEWRPSPDPEDQEYCVFFKEDLKARPARFKKPIQCDVERMLTSDPLMVTSQCVQKEAKPNSLLYQSIGGLNPGKRYVGQLIVRRFKGAALSYDMFHASTAYSCNIPVTQ